MRNIPKYELNEHEAFDKIRAEWESTMRPNRSGTETVQADQPSILRQLVSVGGSSESGNVAYQTQNGHRPATQNGHTSEHN